MQLETGALCGAAPGERTPERLNQRNGCRERGWETRAGTVGLVSPLCGPAFPRNRTGRLPRPIMRNAMAYAGRTQRRIVAAWAGAAFAQDDAAAARKQRRKAAGQARPRMPKLAKLMDGAEADVLACMGFPGQHRVKLHGILRPRSARSAGTPQRRDQAAQRRRRHLSR